MTKREWEVTFDAITDLVTVHGPDFTIRHANKAVCKALGMDADEVIGRKCYELFHHLGHPILDCPGDELIARKLSIITHEVEAMGRVFEVSVYPIEEGGAFKAFVHVGRDVTRIKDLERQKADFYAMVTHDLKSPLMVMLGYSDVITGNAEKSQDEETAGMSRLIYQNGKKILRLVDDFVSVSRLESKGKLPLNPALEDVAELLNEVREEFAAVAEKKGITFRSHIPDDLPRAMIDKKQMERAVGNLLQNAFGYTPGGGEVALMAEKADDGEGECVIISVSDTGPGIPAEERDKVFSKYYRSDKTSGIRGTGLGLAIVKAVMDAHGGRVALESEAGKGSTFMLVLPVGLPIMKFDKKNIT